MNESIVDKYIAGDITDEEFTAEIEKLSPEQKETVRKEAESKKPDILKEIVGLKKERDRQAVKTDEDFSRKFRDEQVNKAKVRFYKDFSIEESNQSEYESMFVKQDEGHVDADLIYANLKRIYGYHNADILLDGRVDADESARRAADFSARGASPTGASGAGSSSESDPIPSEVAEFISRAKKQGIDFTPEQAKKALIPRNGGWSNLV